jgi:cytochrome P450
MGNLLARIGRGRPIAVRTDRAYAPAHGRARGHSFGGYDLPAGVSIAAATWLVHQREDIYPNPTAFEPERFLARKPKPHEYLPFGGGNRRCIGTAFAHYEACVALATILREFELELAEPGEVPTVRRSLTLAPKGGVRMRMVGDRK